ncbi:acyl-CoA N-acyltransferase [Hypoxylon sp. FL1284]|nr:acyl-CoA N-acyltransferase [Hypoxylon sp. FL1284]
MATRPDDPAAPATAVVERATAADIPDLIRVWGDSFNSEFIRRIFPQTEDGRRWLERFFTRNLEEAAAAPGPEQRRRPKVEALFVRSPESGMPVAMAVYHVVPAGCDPALLTWRARWPAFDDLPDISEDAVAGFFEPMEKTQNYLLGDRARVFLEALGTVEAHQKKGYGTALVQWGNALADELGVECYLDASPDGKPLYEKHGYVPQDVSAILEKQAAVSMLRPRKLQA